MNRGIEHAVSITQRAVPNIFNVPAGAALRSEARYQVLGYCSNRLRQQLVHFIRVCMVSSNYQAQSCSTLSMSLYLFRHIIDTT